MAIALANGIRIYYEWHGAESAPVLVLNNGILMNAASSWVYQTSALAAHYRVLQYDCRGQGQSEHPDAPYSMALHADDLAALLTALGVERAHIAGISYGGEVAQAFAIAHPSRARSLVLADTVSEVGPELRLTVESWRDRARAGRWPFRDHGGVELLSRIPRRAPGRGRRRPPALSCARPAVGRPPLRRLPRRRLHRQARRHPCTDLRRRRRT